MVARLHEKIGAHRKKALLTQERNLSMTTLKKNLSLRTQKGTYL